MERNSNISLSGVSVKLIASSQTISDADSLSQYLEARNAAQIKANNDYAKELDLYNRNQIDEIELIDRASQITSARDTTLADIDEQYQNTRGIWGNFECIIKFDCSSPNVSDSVLELQVIFKDGSKGTLHGYPDPLLSNSSYNENLAFRTSDYIANVTSISIRRK
nr:hypothetical protein [uncultured Sphaerochaeta sp.]